MEQSIYSNLKLLNYVDHMKSFASKQVKAPAHIRIKPTNACNHNCWFCAYRVDNLDLGNQMNVRDSIPQTKMQEICNDIIELGVGAVTFSGGGEPLIYKHIEETIETLGRAGVKIGTLSNGAFLTGKKADLYAKYGTWIRISMDYWDNESCAKSRDTGQKEFSKIIKNIKEFKERESNCVLGISFIIGKENHHKLYDFCKMMKELGVDHVKLAGCVISIDGKENNMYHNEIKESVSTQIAQAQELNSDSFKIINHYHETEERFDKDYSSCPFLNMLTVIGADCKVYTCQDKAYTEDGTLGSIKELSFKEFWFSNENQGKMFNLNPQNTCSHHCVSHTKNKMIHEFLNLKQDHKYFV